jgi:hypothetical protein
MNRQQKAGPDRPAGPRRRQARCAHCGKELPRSRGRLPAACPTCGAPRDHEDDPLLRRKAPAHEFHGGALVGTIVGGVLGLFLGAFFGALLHREAGAWAALWALLYAAGFAFLGCAFGFMAVASRQSRLTRPVHPSSVH